MNCQVLCLVGCLFDYKVSASDVSWRDRLETWDTGEMAQGLELAASPRRKQIKRTICPKLQLLSLSGIL